jgi:Glycosyltransferase family 87
MLLKSKRSRSLSYKVFLFLTLVAGIFTLVSLIKNIDPGLVLFGDYVQYWASGKLITSGDNPYDWELIKNVKQSIGHKNPFDNVTPSMFLYPPWALVFVIPIGYADSTFGRVYWLLSNIIIIYGSVLLLWNIFGGKSKNQWAALFIAFTFAPTIFALSIGHFTTIHLLGVTLFLFFTRINRQTSKNYDFLAGMFSAFVSIKPNVLLLFLFAVMLWGVINKRWYLLLGIGSYFILSLVIVLTFNVQIIQHYWEAINKYSLVLWDNPTLGMVLRHLYGIDKSWLLFVPTILGIIWLLLHLKNRIQKWDWQNEVSIIMLMSIVLSPYIWTYDMVPLLIPIIYLFVKISFSGLNLTTLFICFSYGMINIASLILHLNLHDFWFFWLAPAYLVWFLYGNKFIEINSSAPVITDHA